MERLLSGTVATSTLVTSSQGPTVDGGASSDDDVNDAEGKQQDEFIQKVSCLFTLKMNFVLLI